LEASHPALLVVDVQRDFCPGGSLAAQQADRILPALNGYLSAARQSGMPVYASRDWHPAVTSHFKEYGGQWPPHCVQGTEGALFHSDLELPSDVIVITKGDVPHEAGYSAFEGHTPDGKALLDELRDRRIDNVYVAGLTTEYCVKQTVLDALRGGLRVSVLEDAIAPIEARPGDAQRALEEMSEAGAELRRGIPTATRP
jgi:nicotinamidase/pyrazinamidase